MREPKYTDRERKIIERLVAGRQIMVAEYDHIMRCTDPHCERCKGND